MGLSNRNINDKKHKDEINLFMFVMFYLYFNVLMIIHKCANYSNKIIFIFDHELKGLCLSFKCLPV